MSKIKKEVNISFRLFFVLMCIVTALCISTTDSIAKSNDSIKEYEQICKEALETIQGINQDNLNVSIGNVYNVIDIEGNLNGYALGYFVDNEPYGYAIYNLSDKSIREFVFQSGIKNIYEELEEKAEQNDDINEDELINGIVYDGGIGYSTYDTDGNKVDIDSSSPDEELLNDEEIEEIIESKYVKPNSSSYKGEFDNLCNSNKYWDIYDSSTFDSWNIVPDSGLVMLSYDYAKTKIKKYGCTIQSATGILNWMGRLQGSIADTYNAIWNNSNVQLMDNGGEDWLCGGAYLSDVKKYFNSYFASLGIKTRAYMDSDVTFDEVLSHIGSTNSGERAPFCMSIWIDGLDGHTVTVISYLKTSSKNYVGIYNGWYFDENDSQVDENGLKVNVNNNTSYQSVRYIDFEDLKNRNNVKTEGMMFTNVQSANIKEANTQYVCGNVIDIACYVPNGTKHVYFPTWSKKGYDKIWHEGQINGTLATVSIDMTNYNKASGLYGTDIYAYDANMNLLACYGTLYNTVDSSVSNVNISNKTIKGYTFKCKLPTGTKFVKFPTWSKKNGQDDIIWYDGVVTNINGNISGSITIDVANHLNDGGEYYTQVYACDKYGNVIVSYGGDTISVIDRKTITDAKITNVNSNSYTVSCNVPTGTSYVKFPTWTKANGQDDIKMYQSNVLTYSGKVLITIYKSSHNNETGLYYTNIYAYNSKGEIIGTYGWSVNLN